MGLLSSLLAAALALQDRAFIEKHCAECHGPGDPKGGLNLSDLKSDFHDPRTFATWAKVHDRVQDGEMPPKKKRPPPREEIDAFLKSLAQPMTAADRAREAAEGRSTWRRLNRYEYENTLRDLLGAPWLQIKEMLPEDGEAHRYNKVGDALDISHVQMAQYLAAADYSLHEVMATQLERPESTTSRYYARDQRSFANKMKFTEFNRSPERAKALEEQIRAEGGEAASCIADVTQPQSVEVARMRSAA